MTLATFLTLSTSLADLSQSCLRSAPSLPSTPRLSSSGQAPQVSMQFCRTWSFVSSRVHQPYVLYREHVNVSKLSVHSCFAGARFEQTLQVRLHFAWIGLSVQNVIPKLLQNTGSSSSHGSVFSRQSTPSFARPSVSCHLPLLLMARRVSVLPRSPSFSGFTASHGVPSVHFHSPRPLLVPPR